jgi:hypothetical protein
MGKSFFDPTEKWLEQGIIIIIIIVYKGNITINNDDSLPCP